MMDLMGQLGWMEDEGGEAGGGDCSGSGCIEMAFSGGSNLDRGPADPDVDEINRAIMVGRANNKGLPAAEFAAWLTFEIVSLGLMPPIGRTVRLPSAATRTLCFAAGTLVVTSEGNKPIETIEPGELVWSRDDASGEEGWKPVAQTFIKRQQPVLDLTLGSESFNVSAEHPFWTDEEEWAAAGALQPGDLVWSSGGWLEVQGVEEGKSTADVYNLEVEGFHTYFVGDSEVWVHNSCGGTAPVLAGKAGEAAVRSSYAIGDKVRIAINGRTRIPDGMTHRVLSEVKNVKSLSFSRQLRDFSDFAQLTGKRFDLFVRPTTRLSGPLQDAVRNGLINLRFIP